MAQSWPWSSQIAVKKEKNVNSESSFVNMLLNLFLYKLIGEPLRSFDDYHITLQKQKRWILLVVLKLTHTTILDYQLHSSSSIFNNCLGLQFPKQM